VFAKQFERDLQKMGQGTTYYLGFIKVYDATLYTSETAGNDNILSRDVSKCLHLEYNVDIEKNIFVESAETVLGRQFSNQQLLQVKNYIDQIHQGYQDVQEGDSYTLCYDNQSAVTTLALNDSTIVSVDSADFAEVYFSIWLGENEPLDEDLRDDLLSLP
jgi:hypothetical protein